MCVSEPPPTNVIVTSCPATSPQHREQTQDTQDPAGIIADPRLPASGGEVSRPQQTPPALEKDEFNPNANPIELTSSNTPERSTCLSEGVVLQPSSLQAAGPSGHVGSALTSWRRAEELLTGRVPGSGNSSTEGTLVLFLPGAFAAEDVRQSVLESFPESRVFVGHNGVEDAASVSSSPKPLARSSVSTLSNANVTNSGLNCAATCSGDASLADTSPGHVGASPGYTHSEGAGFTSSLSGSSVSNILKHLPPGMVVFFQNKGSAEPGVTDH